MTTPLPLRRLLNSAWLPMLILLLGLGVSATFALSQQRDAAVERRGLALSELHRLSARLEQAVNARLSVTIGLEAFVQSQKDLDLDMADEEQLFRTRFARFTEALDRQVPGVLSMQLAPDAVVRYMTREAENRQALGHDLLVDDSRRSQVLDAIAKRTLIIAGPVQLLQGGVALIARKAIFTTRGHYTPSRYLGSGRAGPGDDWPKRIPDDFWGLATVLIDSTTLYREAGLDALNSEFDIAIRGRHGLGPDGDVFWGDAAVFEHPIATVPVSLPGGQWLLAARDDTHNEGFLALGILVTGCIGSLLLAYTVWSHTARRLAQARNRAKSDFLATMSHELRTPLNAILGFAQLLRFDASLTVDQRDSVEEINKAGEHLLTLINDVLDLARIEAGRLELAIQPVPLNDSLRDALDLIAPTAQKHGIQLAERGGSHYRVLADPVRLRQILLNLLSNAIKYNRQNGRVDIEIGMQPGGQVRITVIDTGKGLSPQQQKDIFQPFHRLDRDRNEVEGTGIGLIISRNLVEKMGGRLGIDSEEGRGSRFWFDLPLDNN